MQELKAFYYYLHENGDIIHKTQTVVEFNMTPKQYFKGPNVIKWWKIYNRHTLAKFVAEVQDWLIDIRRENNNKSIPDNDVKIALERTDKRLNDIRRKYEVSFSEIERYKKSIVNNKQENES